MYSVYASSDATDCIMSRSKDRPSRDAILGDVPTNDEAKVGATLVAVLSKAALVHKLFLPSNQRRFQGTHGIASKGESPYSGNNMLCIVELWSILQ